MGYNQKSGPLQRAGYNKKATTPFKQDQDPVLDSTAGTRIAAGLRDEFGTLVPEGDFTSGVTVSAELPEQTKKALNRFQKNMRNYQPVGNIANDRGATKLKWANELKPELMADVKQESIDAFGSGAGGVRRNLQVMKIGQLNAKKHRAKQKN